MDKIYEELSDIKAQLARFDEAIKSFQQDRIIESSSKNHTENLIDKVSSKVKILESSYRDLKSAIDNLSSKNTAHDKILDEIKNQLSTFESIINELKEHHNEFLIKINRSYESCGGYKELRGMVDAIDDRTKSLERDEASRKKWFTWRMGIFAAIIIFVITSLLIAFFSLFFQPNELIQNPDKINILIDKLDLLLGSVTK